MSLTFGACQAWLSIDEVPELACCQGVTFPIADPDDEAFFVMLLSWSTNILYVMSGKSEGLCEYTTWPCPSCECRHSPCQCNTYNALRLGSLAAPLYEVIDVEIDGEPFFDWRVDNYQDLVRLDGEHWPRLTNSGTASPMGMRVTASYGVPPSLEAKRAAAMLACQEYLRCKGLECLLPSRVQTISAQGMSYTIIDPMVFLEKGRTGILQIDLWLRNRAPFGPEDSGISNLQLGPCGDIGLLLDTNPLVS